MASEVMRLAEAVRAFIESASVSSPFEDVVPVLQLIPRVSLKETATLRVLVAPKSQSSAVDSRRTTMEVMEVDIGVIRTVDNAEEQMDMLDLACRINDLFRFTKLPGFEEAEWVGSESDPIYNPEALDERRQFISVHTLTYKTRKGV